MKTIDASILSEVYKERDIESRKYDFGMVIIIGGSDFYSGSPALSAMAAFRSGADMVRIIAPKRAADIIASFTPDMAAYPLKGNYLTQKDIPILVSMTEAAKVAARDNIAVVLGGGIGLSKETQDTVLEYLSKISVTTIIDADAITAIKSDPKVLEGKECIITPHYNEFYRLTGKDIYELPLEEKIETVKEEARDLGATILLKGSVDIISDGSEVAINEIGSPYLTVGGCGDTLAGIVGAIASRKTPAVKAASAAAYINVVAGRLAAQKFGESLTALDLIGFIPNVIKNNFKENEQSI
ncbi:MAG: NAD(P)H-hydrate dehydratase [Minisyncoccales bacterium]|jgi:hydroxyethylthiazole kinase-like uncharacterized protein yjeF